MNHRLNKNHGVAAILIVSAMALLFIILVVGLSTISLREQKQAGDNDQSNQAMALAEAGVTDGFAILDNRPEYRESECNSNGEENNKNMGISCRTITSTPGEISGKLEKDEGEIIRADLADVEGSASKVRYSTKVIIDYCKTDAGGDGDCTVNQFNAGDLYPDPTSITAGPTMLEVSLISWRASGKNAGDMPIEPDKIKTTTFLIAPHNSDQSPLVSKYKPISKCNAPVDVYQCRVEINTAQALNVSEEDNKSHRIFVKVKSRYLTNHYKMTFLTKLEDTTSEVPMLVPAKDVKVDVTAKSGNVYRRLIANRSIKYSVNMSTFDNALYAAGNICKNMTVNQDLSLKAANNCE